MHPRGPALSYKEAIQMLHFSLYVCLLFVMATAHWTEQRTVNIFMSLTFGTLWTFIT